jgi:hypothetical protein
MSDKASACKNKCVQAFLKLERLLRWERLTFSALYYQACMTLRWYQAPQDINRVLFTFECVTEI